MTEREKRHFAVLIVAMIVIGGPTAFILPYTLPEDISRFDRGLASAAVFTVTTLISEVIAKVAVRRSFQRAP